MNKYQFEQIEKRMEREFGKIRKGEEDAHEMMLLTIESNLLKVHRKQKGANSRRLEEAILLALYKIEDRIRGTETDVCNFETPESAPLKDALLFSFDPFSNKHIAVLLENEGIELTDEDVLRKYYKEPVQCILRIKESVKLWIKNRGSDGYFNFLEECIGSQITDEELRCTVQLDRS